MVFQDHTETICGYLNWYKSSLQKTEVDKDQWNTQSDKFSKYLVMTCWKKMEQQISHWSGLGLIYHLVRITNGGDATMYTRFTTAVSQLRSSPELAKNQVLQVHLKELLNKKTLVFILQGQVGRSNKEAVMKLLQACDNNVGRSLYTCDTAKAFHNLLVGTLIAYANFLCGIKQHIFAGTLKNAGVSACGFLSMVHLLDAIVHSKAFDQHIKLLQQVQCLELLSQQCQADYMEFSAEKGMMSDTPRKHDGDNRDDEDKGYDEDKRDNEDEDDQPQDQYLNNPQCTMSCWIKLLVKHLIAKHRLETHCCRLHTHGIKSTFEINILRVDKIEDDLPLWKEVTSIITSVIQKYFPFNNFPSSDTDLQMINWLLQYIDETLQDVPSSTSSESSTSMSRNYDYIFQVFQDILDRIKCLPFYKLLALASISRGNTLE